jgi:hypothetical protein
MPVPNNQMAAGTGTGLITYVEVTCHAIAIDKDLVDWEAGVVGRTGIWAWRQSKKRQMLNVKYRLFWIR